MRKLIFVLPFLILLAACGGSSQKTVEKPVITVTILPEKTFIEKIAGDDFKVNVLIPPGANPHSYALLPSQLVDLAHSVAWLRIGHVGFEYSWKEKISESNSNMKVYDLSEGVGLISEETESHGGHGHVGGIDPHIWMSPAIVKKMAKKIRDILTEINPGETEKYLTGYNQFVKEIDLTHVSIKNLLKDYQGKTFITFHPSLSYFARDYGLNQVTLEDDGKEPTPQHMKEIVDLANRENIKVIYIQSDFDRDNATVFAEEIKGRIIEVTPLAPDWSDNLIKMATQFRDNF